MVSLSPARIESRGETDKPPLIVEAEVRVTVLQKRGDVAFTAESRAPRAHTWVRSRIGHLAVSRRDGNTTTFVWEIYAPVGVEAADTVLYGNPPPGFVQTTPRNGFAPLLERGTTYSVFVMWGSTSFIYGDSAAPMETGSVGERVR